ncbi:HU family DNA-binding protein [Bathymodiolus thermophilus thioautotrophic gill symbiont]
MQLTNFGYFMVRNRVSRTGCNPKNGATIEIAATRVAAFKARKALKRRC